MSISEKLGRERTRATALAAIELILGVLIIYIGLQLFIASEHFRFAIFEMQQNSYVPEYMLGIYRTILAVILAGGFFALVHGVKRIVDNALKAWIKSAVPKES